jgi:hypothetical protein
MHSGLHVKNNKINYKIPNQNYCMKQIILSIVISLAVFVAAAQIPKSANYEAANWKTMLLDSAQKITIAAPPDAAKSKAELQIIKQEMNKVDEKKLTEIKYWDAGAPSYRWNQIHCSA